jgi:hypothetical protein
LVFLSTKTPTGDEEAAESLGGRRLEEEFGDKEELWLSCGEDTSDPILRCWRVGDREDCSAAAEEETVGGAAEGTVVGVMTTEFTPDTVARSGGGEAAEAGGVVASCATMGCRL